MTVLYRFGAKMAQKASSWDQILSLQTKNFRTLKRDGKRMLMLIIYPVYMVLLLYGLRLGSEGESKQIWTSLDPISIQPFSLAGAVLSYECGQQVNMTMCSMVVENLILSTGARMFAVSNVAEHWQTHQSEVFGGLSFESLAHGNIAYTIYLPNYNGFASAVAAGDSVMNTERANPDASLAKEAFVDSAFVYLQRSVDCSAAAVLTNGRAGGGWCSVPSLQAFPTVRFESLYSTNESLGFVIPFYIVLAFINVVVFVALQV